VILKAKTVVICGGALLATLIVAYIYSIDGATTQSSSRWNYGRGSPFSAHTPSFMPDCSAFVFDSDTAGDGNLYRFNLRGSNITRLTKARNLEMHPLLSPDGHRLAFVRETKRYQHIWMASPDGSDEAQITHGRVLDSVHSFSADGTQLRFVRSNWRGRALLAQRELFEVIISGSNARQVLRIGEVDAISPDGQAVVYSVSSPGLKNPELWLRSRDGTNSRLIGFGYSASFSRSGNRIVYLRQRENYNYDIVTVFTDGKGEMIVPGLVEGYKTEPQFVCADRAISFRIVRRSGTMRDGVYLIDLQTLETRAFSCAIEPLRLDHK
jgi:Tol biopolymer transport system component